jgi:hypothetical protein
LIKRCLVYLDVQHLPGGVQRQVAHGRKVEEIDTPVARRGQLALRAAQGLVLLLQRPPVRGLQPRFQAGPACRLGMWRIHALPGCGIARGPAQRPGVCAGRLPAAQPWAVLAGRAGC